MLGQGINLPTDPVQLYKDICKLGKWHQKHTPDKNSGILWFSPINPIKITFGADDVEYIVKDRVYNDKHFFYQYLHDWLGTGLLTSDGAKWQKRRRMITPAFHFNILRNFSPIMNKNSRTMARLLYEKLKASGQDSIETNIFPSITLAALDTICEAAMGKDIKAQTQADSRYVRAIDKTGRRVVNRMEKFYLWPRMFFNLFVGKAYYDDIEFMQTFTDGVIQERIAARKKQKAAGDDQVSEKRQLAFLDILLENYDTEEIDLKGIREEVETFMFEGHDTTASAMNFMAHFLGHDADRQKQAQNEIDEVLTNTDADLSFHENLEAFEVNYDSIARLSYLDACAREALRLLPSVTFIGRTHPVEKSIGLAIMVNLVCTDERQWKDADSFIPERFLDKNVKRHPYAWIPFSAGYRNCIGQRFAMMEMVIQMAYLFKFFNVESLDKTDELNIQPNLIIRPRDGVNVRLSLRKPQDS